MSAAARHQQRKEAEEEEKEESHDLAAGQDVTAEASSEEDDGRAAASETRREESRSGRRGTLRFFWKHRMHADYTTVTDTTRASRSQEPLSYLEAEPEQLLPPPSFHPFFALIRDPNGEYQHPTVHYIFSNDEESGILTSASLSAIEAQDQTRPASTNEQEERIVVLDLDADAKTVAGVQSLSGNWQGITAEVSKAPSWGGREEGEGGLMVQVSGRESDGHAAGEGESLEDLVERFGRGLGDLDEVMGAEEPETESSRSKE